MAGAKSLPTPDLKPIDIGKPASHDIAAIPLEPAQWVLRCDLALGLPLGAVEAGSNVEVVEGHVEPVGAQFGVLEPFGRVFGDVTFEIPAAEDAEFKHLHGRQLRLETKIVVIVIRFGCRSVILGPSAGRHVNFRAARAYPALCCRLPRPRASRCRGRWLGH